MKSIEDAMRIRRRIFGAFELAESATDPAERKRWLTFALVGAGLAIREPGPVGRSHGIGWPATCWVTGPR